MLMIADDFTGALDTGVQFSEAGAHVKVITDTNIHFDQETDADVLVLDAETRHVPYQQAYKIVYDITKRATACGIPHIFKKTDSALRGNIGSELTAILDASGRNVLPFIPAFPQMNRFTIHGIQYIDGLPAEKSVFGRDPFEPVRNSFIPDVIGETSRIHVHCFSKGEIPDSQYRGIAVFDIESDDELKQLAKKLYHTGNLSIAAGCAGLAGCLPQLLGWQSPPQKIKFHRGSRFLAACGSVNPITRSQIDYAARNGFQRIHLTPEQKLTPGYWTSPKGQADEKKILEFFLNSRMNIIDSNDRTDNRATQEFIDKQNLSLHVLRSSITASIGCLTRKLIEAGTADTLMIMGGDTLLGFLKEIHVSEMHPICEVLPGTVLSDFTYLGKTYHILSKSGGFGEEKLLTEIAEIMIEKNTSHEENERRQSKCRTVTT